MLVRQMQAKDRSEVADLICTSTNHWYQMHGGSASFPAGPEVTDVFFEVYEAIDPGCGIVAENADTGRLMGSCFYHPRPLHCSLGIMNVHPNYFGRKVARELLAHIIDYADQQGYPAVRLTSSAMNLDSFSLYNRAGFVTRDVYQDMFIDVPPEGCSATVENIDRVRPATPDDVEQMAQLELEVSGIRRDDDYRFAIDNRGEIWDSLAYEGQDGAIEGFLISVKHPAMPILGPGVMRTQEQAAALIAKALDRYAGGSALLLVPVLSGDLVRQLYGWGARNCELHFCQVRGKFQPFAGVNMPTFLPETG